jgi:hypothetical protein
MEYQFLGYYFSATQLIVTAVVVVLVVAIVVAFFVQRRRTRTAAFRNRFGTEYDRAVLTHGSAHKAEAQLAEREHRVDEMKIRELGVTERERFVTDWKTVQSHFVDHPQAAVTEADNLINALLEARGYPQAGFDQRADDVSVNYPRVMENYREAHAVAIRASQPEATTEELRKAMIHYRDIFDDLLQGHVKTALRSAA